MKQVTVKMSNQLHGRLQDAAEARGGTVAGAVRDLLTEHLDQADQLAELAQEVDEIRSLQVLALATAFAGAKDLDFDRDVVPQVQVIARAWNKLVKVGALAEEAEHG